MLQEHAGWVVVGAILVVLLVALGIAAWSSDRTSRRRGAHRARRWGRRPHRNEFRPEGTVTEAPRRRVAIIVNPTKFDDLDSVKEHVTRHVVDHGWAEPVFIETTARDTGRGQAEQALRDGVDLVCPLGGDGTVRAVAEALVGSDTPLGLLPGGTGNLLARNLELPLGNASAALGVALDGVDRTIDVGRLTVERWAEAGTPQEAPAEHVFLVIGGVGVDAAMVADADEQLKARVGWIAYFVAAVRHLHGRRLRVRVKVDDREWTEVRGRSLLVGNVGRLPGGITLLPDARIDDGWLDLAALDARGGVAGWVQLAGEVLLQRIGVRNELPAKIGRIDHVRARQVKVQIVGGEQVQVDGESVGRAKQLSARVDPAALVVRVAAPRS